MSIATPPSGPAGPAPEIPSTPAGKALRSDGQEARQRLLDAALTLFADQGFSKTSTREIARAAQVNIAAISYYFGDKAGLYRAVWRDPRCNPDITPTDFNGIDLSLPEALGGLLSGFVAPLKEGNRIHQCMRLHFREMLEPTGIWQEEIENNIKPNHTALVDMVCRHLGLADADDDIHRLCFSIVGLGVMLQLGGDVFSTIRPPLVASPEALDQYGERLVTYALAMVQAEGQRRNSPQLRQSAPSALQVRP